MISNGYFIDVCTDIYVMMSSDLYGTYKHCLYGALSRTHGHSCNPFGNLATVSVMQDVADIVYSICNIFHFIFDK